MRVTTQLLLPMAVLGGVCDAANPTISNDLYALFVRYTKYASAAYATVCPQPPNNSTVVQYFDEATTDTQATLFRNDVDKEFVIAFRGTSTPQDFATDANQALVPITAPATEACTGCLVNKGTQIAWNSVASTITTALRSALSTNPTYNLTITGHSLGGALASLASATLHGRGFTFKTYTMGQFRTGNPVYANFIDAILPPPGDFFRITHLNDGVPQTIPRSRGYRHHSTEYWELEPFGAGRTFRCEGQEDPTCNDSTLGLGLGTSSPFGINAAHLCYTGILIGNPVDRGASACNAFSVLPQRCSSISGGGIVRCGGV